MTAGNARSWVILDRQDFNDQKYFGEGSQQPALRIMLCFFRSNIGPSNPALLDESRHDCGVKA